MKPTAPITFLALCAITAHSFLPGLASAPRFAYASGNKAHKEGQDEAPVAKDQQQQSDESSGKMPRPMPRAVWPSMRGIGSLLGMMDVFDELEATMFGDEDHFMRSSPFWRQSQGQQQQQLQGGTDGGDQQESGGALQQQQSNKGLMSRWGMPAMGHLDLAEVGLMA